jgi:hypothetical protein
MTYKYICYALNETEHQVIILNYDRKLELTPDVVNDDLLIFINDVKLNWLHKSQLTKCHFVQM